MSCPFMRIKFMNANSELVEAQRNIAKALDESEKQGMTWFKKYLS